MTLDTNGEPIYGDRDQPDLPKIAALGLPYWMAGSYGERGGFAAAEALGAVGIQVGTAFAFCEESGIDPDLKRTVLAASRARQLRVFTDPVVLPHRISFQSDQRLSRGEDSGVRRRPDPGVRSGVSPASLPES